MEQFLRVKYGKSNMPPISRIMVAFVSQVILNGLVCGMLLGVIRIPYNNKASSKL